MGGPYKFLSELGFCAACAEAFFLQKILKNKIVSFSKLFPLLLIPPRIAADKNKT